MRVIAIVLSVATSCALAQADDCPPEIESLLNKCLDARRAAIARIDHHLESIAKQQVSVRDRKQHLKTTYARMVELRLGEELLLPILDPQLNIGDIGASFIEPTIEKVIDEFNAVVRCELTTPDLMKRVNRTIWLKGFSTQNWTEGNTADVLHIEVRLSGVKAYQSANGKKQDLKVVEKYDTAAVKRCFRVIPLAEFENRQWRPAGDRDPFIAVVSGYQDGKVELRRADAKIISLPTAELERI